MQSSQYLWTILQEKIDRGKNWQVLELRQSTQMAVLLLDTVGSVSWAVLKQEYEEFCNCLPSLQHDIVQYQHILLLPVFWLNRKSLLRYLCVGTQKDRGSLCMFSCNDQTAGCSHTISPADRAAWGVLPICSAKGWMPIVEYGGRRTPLRCH